MTDLAEGGFGSLPDTWTIDTLGNTCQRPQYGYTASSTTSPIGPKFLRITDLEDNGTINWDTVPYCACDGDNLEKCRLQAGDLVFARIGATTGKCSLLTKCPESVFASYLIRFRPEKVDAAFIYFFCQSDFYWRQVDAVKGEKLKGGISGSVLAAVKHVLPPSDEQRAIAATLGSIQNAIIHQGKIIASLKELKTATMEHLFSCGVTHAETKDSAIGSIPSHWEVKRIDEIADLVSGGTPSKSRPDWWKGSIPWASPKDMKVPRLHDAPDKITQEAAEAGSRIVPAKTIFVVIRGMILIRDVPMAITEVPMAFNQDMKAIMAHDSVDPDFLFFAMQNRRSALFQEISTSAHGTRRMGTSVIESMQIALPKDKHEQMEIRDAIRQIDDQIANKEQKRSSLQDLFASTLSAMMSGSLRTTPLLAG